MNWEVPPDKLSMSQGHLTAHAAAHLSTGQEAYEVAHDGPHGEGQLNVVVAMLGGSRPNLLPPPRTFIMFAYRRVPHTT